MFIFFSFNLKTISLHFFFLYCLIMLTFYFVSKFSSFHRCKTEEAFSIYSKNVAHSHRICNICHVCFSSLFHSYDTHCLFLNMEFLTFGCVCSKMPTEWITFSWMFVWTFRFLQLNRTKKKLSDFFSCCNDDLWFKSIAFTLTHVDIKYSIVSFK